MDILLPDLIPDLIETDDPNEAILIMDNDLHEPVDTNPTILQLEEILLKFLIDNDDPKCNYDNILALLPDLIQLLIDIDDPIVLIFNIDNFPLVLIIFLQLNADDNYTNDLTLILPDILLLPDRTLIVLPNVKYDNIDVFLPIRKLPQADKLEPIRQ
jgi:hypothetical protein